MTDRSQPLSEEDEKHLRDFGEWDGSRDTHKVVVRLLDLLHAEQERAEKAERERNEALAAMSAETADVVLAKCVTESDLEKAETDLHTAQESLELIASMTPGAFAQPAIEVAQRWMRRRPSRSPK